MTASAYRLFLAINSEMDKDVWYFVFLFFFPSKMQVSVCKNLKCTVRHYYLFVISLILILKLAYDFKLGICG